MNISCKCDTNRVGHFTFDAYASRPVACQIYDTLGILKFEYINKYLIGRLMFLLCHKQLTDFFSSFFDNNSDISWWHNQMETVSALLALCEANPSGQRWIPLTKDSDTELWCFLWCPSEQTVKQTVKLPVIWDAMMSLWRQCNVAACHKDSNSLPSSSG